MACRAARRLTRSARCLSLAVLIWLLALCLFAAPVQAQAPQDVQKTAEQTIRRLDLQTELPREPEPKRLTFKLPSEVLWLVVAVAIGVLVYAFRDLILVGRS